MKVRIISSPSRLTNFHKTSQSFQAPLDSPTDQHQSLLDNISKRNTAKIFHKKNESSTLRTQAKVAQRRLSALINYFPGGILIETPKHKILQVNQKFCDIFGIETSPASLQGTAYDSIIEQVKDLFIDTELFLRSQEQYIKFGKPVKANKFPLKDGRVLSCDYLPLEIVPGYVENLWHFREVKK